VSIRSTYTHDMSKNTVQIDIFAERVD